MSSGHPDHRPLDSVILPPPSIALEADVTAPLISVVLTLNGNEKTGVPDNRAFFSVRPPTIVVGPM